MDIKNETNKQLVVKMAEPLDPKCLPKNPAKHEPMMVNKINTKYILNKTLFFII